MSSPSELLPPNLKKAAELYCSRTLEDPSTMLFSAFGIAARGGKTHRQATWLCCLAVRRILYGWKTGGCDGDLPDRTISAVETWVRSNAEADWQLLSTPAPLVRNGYPVTDCDASRLGPIADAAAATARFANDAYPPNAAEALDSVWLAVDNGVHFLKEMVFELWLCEIALPAAMDFTILGNEQLRR